MLNNSYCIDQVDFIILFDAYCMFWLLEQIVTTVAMFMIEINNFMITIIANMDYNYYYIWNNCKIT
jgi:hypothetical protein